MRGQLLHKAHGIVAQIAEDTGGHRRQMMRYIEPGRIGLSQERLAIESRIDRRYMSGLERGLHTPSLEKIIQILPTLKVTFSKFAREFELALKQVQGKKK